MDALRLPLNPRRTQEFGWGGGGFGGGSCPWLLVGGVALALGSLVAWRGSRWFPLPCPAGFVPYGCLFPPAGLLGWVGLPRVRGGVAVPSLASAALARLLLSIAQLSPLLRSVSAWGA